MSCSFIEYQIGHTQIPFFSIGSQAPVGNYHLRLADEITRGTNIPSNYASKKDQIGKLYQSDDMANFLKDIFIVFVL